MYMGEGVAYALPRCFTATFSQEELRIMEMDIVYILRRNSKKE
jgi:hypothetical protein